MVRGANEHVHRRHHEERQQRADRQHDKDHQTHAMPPCSKPVIVCTAPHAQAVALRSVTSAGEDAGHNYMGWIETGGGFGSRTWFEMDHDLVVGTDYETRRDANGDFLQVRNVGGFFPAAPSITNGNSRIKGQSLYVKDNIHLSEKWILAPGLRYQQ